MEMKYWFYVTCKVYKASINGTFFTLLHYCIPTTFQKSETNGHINIQSLFKNESIKNIFLSFYELFRKCLISLWLGSILHWLCVTYLINVINNNLGYISLYKMWFKVFAEIFLYFSDINHDVKLQIFTFSFDVHTCKIFLNS